MQKEWTNVHHVCPQGHGCERVVQEAAASSTVSGAVLHHDFLLGRDHRQSRDPLTDPAPQRVPHAVQHRGVSRLHCFNQGEREAAAIAVTLACEMTLTRGVSSTARH